MIFQLAPPTLPRFQNVMLRSSASSATNVNRPIAAPASGHELAGRLLHGDVLPAAGLALGGGDASAVAGAVLRSDSMTASPDSPVICASARNPRVWRSSV